MILKCQCLIIIFLLLEFSEGSIIASINVSFLAIDALQLISLQEELAGGTLGTTPAELLNLSSSYGKLGYCEYHRVEIKWVVFYSSFVPLLNTQLNEFACATFGS